VLLRNAIKPVPDCREVRGSTVEECLDCARSAFTQFRAGWLRAIGAPDYKAYLAHHAARHLDAEPLSERDYVKLFIERRYNGPGAARCC
jgi:uncharacterized short protein YbdD (DUF466 family)